MGSQAATKDTPIIAKIGNYGFGIDFMHNLWYNRGYECFKELKSIHNSMHDMLGCILSTICDNCNCDEGETNPEEKVKD